jgi:hypothetical protein
MEKKINLKLQMWHQVLLTTLTTDYGLLALPATTNKQVSNSVPVPKTKKIASKML